MTFLKKLLEQEKIYNQKRNYDLFYKKYLEIKKQHSLSERWDGLFYFVDFQIYIGKYFEAYEEWLNITNNDTSPSISSLIKFELLLKKRLLNGELIFKFLYDKSCLTDFGQRNIDDILKYCDKLLNKEYGSKSFFRHFYERLELIDHTVVKYFVQGNVILQKTKKANEYEFLFKKDFFKIEKKDFYKNNPSDKIISKEILNNLFQSEFWRILRQAENNFRVSIDMKKIGEGWVSETELFNLLKKQFSKIKVVQHGKPKWLGRQHVDIWFPDYNIGVEFQGLQHDQPIEFFGGEESFIKNQKRDKRKRNLFEINNAHLIEVRSGYIIDDIFNKISKIIEKS